MEAKNKPIWLKYMPDYVDLYYVDYRDDLCDHIKLLEEVIQKNNFYPFSETVYDWFDYPEGPYLDEIRNKMDADGLLEIYEENEEDIKQWLWDHDKSDPVKDLLRNTGPVTMFYSLGVEIGEAVYNGHGYSYGCDSYSMATYKVRRALGITKGSSASRLIDSIVANSPYGGELKIYFEAEIGDLIAGDKYETAENKDDFKSIQFKGKHLVALHDSAGGSGDYEEIELDLSIPFSRDNLHVSKIEKYSMENVCGHGWSWVGTNGNVLCSFGTSKRRPIKKSKTNTRLSNEAQYNKTFKEGGCTFGDMDIHRHRDVYYDNGYPAGNRCPHCGTFWID